MHKPLLVCLLALSASLPLSQKAHASPTQHPDELGSFLAQKGLIERLTDSLNHATDRATQLVSHAMESLGVPYRLGGTSAESGFDCSGFVRAVYEKTMGLMLPRTAAEQAAATNLIAKADLKPGDLVFFNTLRRPNSHVGIYVGDGKFIHAPRAGSKVRVESMNVSYWQRRFNGARRVDAVHATDEPASTQLAKLQQSTEAQPLLAAHTPAQEPSASVADTSAPSAKAKDRSSSSTRQAKNTRTSKATKTAGKSRTTTAKKASADGKKTASAKRVIKRDTPAARTTRLGQASSKPAARTAATKASTRSRSAKRA